jgi:cysteine synthase B
VTCTVAPPRQRRLETGWLREIAVVRAIGDTPLLPLRRLAERHGIRPEIDLNLKAEWNNPGGSVKDRPALAIVEDALASGELGPHSALLDSTSGNTGIAYAMLGAAIGFEVVLVLPGSASIERKRILRAYGATIVESDPYDGSNGAIRHARALAADQPGHYFYANQYGNPANPRAHYESTGPELWRQTGGRITHLVAGLGTTGTLMGTGRFLRRAQPAVELVAVQPADAFHAIEGLKHLPTAIVPDIYDASLPDRQMAIDTDEAYEVTRELARVEGLFCGTSTGAAVAAMLRRAGELSTVGEPAVMVAIAPDGGAKYLSTGLWS